MSILIKSVQLDNRITDIAIEGNRIAKIAPGITGTFDSVIDGSSKLALPPFYNTHGHTAMTLFRGIADNLELFDWLYNHIWPAEENLTEESVYLGSKLAILEMIKTGTVFFNDMYFYPHATIRAAEEMGIRAMIGMISADRVSPEKQKFYHSHNRMVMEKKTGIFLPDPACIFASRDLHCPGRNLAGSRRAIRRKTDSYSYTSC